MLTRLFIHIGLFLFLVFHISFILSMITTEENPRILAKSVLKNLFLICLTVIVLGGFSMFIITVF